MWLIAVNIIATSIWVGGMVAIFFVTRVITKTLDPSGRVAFFRQFGRLWGVVGGSALLVALASGAALLEGHRWDALLISTVIAAVALLLLTAAGMAQARAMTRLRQRSLAEVDADLSGEVRRGAIVAAGLRASIATVTLALVVLGSALAH